MKKMKYRHMKHRPMMYRIKKSCLSTLLLSVPLLLFFSQAGVCSNTGPTINLKEKAVSLGKAPQNSKMYGITVSAPDSKHMAYVTRVDNKMAVHIDGKKGPDFAAIAKGTLFSALKQTVLPI